MKKISALILSLALCVGMLAGCGSKEEPAPAPAPAPAPEASQPAEPTPAPEAPAASAWPNGTVTLLCGFGAGGSSDIETRTLATYLEKVTGGTFVVQNVTGANGWMAWDQLLNSDADGQTLAMVNTPALFYDYLDPSQGHKETMDDFDFICNEVIDFGVLVCKKGTYANMDEFMAMAKTDGATVADVGANGNKHIAIIEMGLQNPDADLISVHQSGWADNYAALLGGTVDAVSAVYGDIASILAEDELTVLCVFNDERVDVLPDVPTCEEAGYGAVYEAPARGYMMPKGIDAATKEAIVKAFNAAVNDPDHVADLEKMGLIVNYKEGDEYVDFLKGQETTVMALKPQLGWE